MRSSPDAAVDEILPAPMPRPRYLLSAPISPPNRGISRNIQHTWCRIKSNILRWQPPTTNSRAQKMILKSQDLKKKKKKSDKAVPTVAAGGVKIESVEKFLQFLSLPLPAPPSGSGSGDSCMCTRVSPRQDWTPVLE